MRREGSHAPCKRQRPFGFDARTCTRTLAITYAHPHAQAQSITDTRSHARTRSYYLPVVNDTSQRTPTVLYAHGSCGGRVHITRADACCAVIVESSCVSGAPRLSQLGALDSMRRLLPLSIAIFALDRSMRSARAEARCTQDSYI